MTNRADPGGGQLRDHLTAAELATHRAALRSALRAATAEWGLLAYSVRGSGDALEIEIKVDPGARGKLPDPATISLPAEIGGRLRLRVAVAGERRGEEPPVSFSGPSYPSVREPLAPGAPILVGRGTSVRRGGICAILLLDGKLHALTCGHIYNDGETGLLTRRGAVQVATLRRNYLRDEEPLDAAVCELLPSAMNLLRQSTTAPTWFRAYLEPAVEDNAGTTTFFPTFREDAPPIDASVSAYSASTTVLFPAGPFDDFIELGLAVIPGDSGSLLAKDDLYFGLCSGEVQATWSYFTPISAVLARLSRDYQEVAIWHPDTGPSSAS